MTMAGGFEVEYDEAWAAGSASLAAGDGVTATGRAGLLLGASSYGGDDLARAGRRFAERCEHMLVQGIGEDAISAGESLRATVTDYRDSDIMAPGLLPSAPSGAPL